MTFDFKQWINELAAKVKQTFGSRVLFIGYQGSYKRGEATDESDIDMVVILDHLEIDDLKKYRQIVRSMPESQKACGFISGREELAGWSKGDLFQFYYETEAIFGKLEDILSPLQKEDVRQMVKTSAQNLYHAACHSFLYDADRKQSLAGLLKMSFFVLQGWYFLQTQKYVPTKKALLPLLTGVHQNLLTECMLRHELPNLDDQEIEKRYDQLIRWCQGAMKTV